MTATAQQLAVTIGSLSLTFPKFVTQEIARLTDQFTSAVKGVSNPLASSGDMSLVKMIAAVAQMGGTTSGVAQASPSMLNNAVSSELQSMAPGGVSAPSGDRITDVMNLAGSVAGNAMLTLSFLPESPYIAAQSICGTILSLTTMKLVNLNCLRKHITQLANLLYVLIENRQPINEGLYQELNNLQISVTTAIAEFRQSRRSTGGTVVFDSKAFDRGRTAIDNALSVISPSFESGMDSILSATNVLVGGLPMNYNSPANAKLALTVAPLLIQMISNEVAAVKEQTLSINKHLQALATLITSYQNSSTAALLRDMRLQTINTIILKLQDLQGQVAVALDRVETPTTAGGMLPWVARLRAIQVLASTVKDTKLQEGSSTSPAEAAALALAHSKLVTDIQAINSAHVVEGQEDVTDLLRQCSGIYFQGGAILRQLDDSAGISLSTLRTFQVLVSTAAFQSTSRIAESQAAATALQAACAPMGAISIVAKPVFDTLVGSLDQLGLDRAKDLLMMGDFGTFLSLSLNDMSYLGTAISALTMAMQGIDDSGLRRRLSSIINDLIGQRTGKLLTASDNLEYAGLRRVSDIQNSISALQYSAQTVIGILAQIKSIADAIGGVVVNPASFTEMLTDTSHLAIGGGGRLAGDVWQLTQGSMPPVC